MLERKQLKDKLVVYISVVLIVLISCFGIISILTAGSSFSADTEIVWDGVTVASSFSAGNGTEDNPYLISNGEELAYFKQLIESDDNVTYADKYYALSADINLDNHEWLPIGSASNIFKGFFDGAGHTISNLKVLEGQIIDGVNYYGLFSIIEDANIVNLNINNLVVNPNSSENIYKVGSLVGEVKTTYTSTDESTIEEDTSTDEVIEDEITTDEVIEDTSTTEITYNSEISNISIYNSLIDLSNISSNDSNMIGGLSASIGANVNLYNIYLGVSITSDYVTGIGKISHTLQSNSNYIITNVTTNSILVDDAPNYVISDGVEITNHFTKSTEGYVNGEEVVDSNSLILIINENLDYKYTWVDEEDILKISIIDFSSTEEEFESIKTFAFSPSATISLHDTGTDGSTVYINDLDSDLNYYKGLNYTDFSSTGTLPTGTPLTTYNNLAKIYIKYSGTSIVDSSLTGYVSLSEQYSDFVYYKYYPVVDGYVTIELIDNPYADRPDNMVFNGWFTDYSGAEVWLDTDIYTRFVKIPVTDTSNPISITFYANWFGGGKVTEVTTDGTDLDSALGDLDSAGFINYTQTPVYEDPPATLYSINSLDFGSSYPSGALSASGQTLRNTCWTWGGCTYYLAIDMNNYDPSGSYYQFINRTMTLYVPVISGYEPNPDFAVGTPVFGLYKEVTVANGASLAGYYDASTAYYSSGTCSSSGGCTVYEEQGYVDEEGNELTYDGITAYYYLATRDTNIVVLRADVTATLTNSKPFTLTGIHNGQDYISEGSYNINGSYIYAGADLRIEWINLTANRTASSSDSNIATSTGDSSYIYGNWYNLKIGRGITYETNVTARGILGGGNNSTGSSSSLTKYRLIIESGYYNVLSVTNGSVSSGWGSSVTDYIDGTAIYGNDLDRINSDNDNLVVYFSACGSWGGYIYSSDEQTGIAINTNVKSGSFGTSKVDYSTGIYIGGRSGGTHYAARRGVVEGGWIYNLIGGPLTADNRSNTNDTYINIKGGSVDYVIGGAGASATYGNRIINHTGGTVNYSIFGGSNGYTGSDNGNYKGTLEGSTFIYVGGNAVVGDDTLVTNNSSVFGAEAGSVFGIGNGNSSSSYVGTADNSNIIIDGATIKRNVYGGGNYGPVGAYASTTPKTNIQILNGTINGSVYGGGNNNGAGTSSVKAEINITMENGTVLGSIYGGSKTKGTVYGKTFVSVLGGKVTTDVYGGGEGGYTDSNNPGTFVSDDVSVIIGDSVNANDLTIDGSVYGGSAYGTVNGSSNSGSASSYTTAVTVNRGVITNSVFGGGKGSSGYTPKVYGNVIVNINGGNIGSVYGGNDAAGSPSGTDYVYLSGGIIGNAFGGGNNTGQTNTNIYLQGSTVTNLYGGSNSSGTVDVSNVIVTSGTVQGNIYGGNNVGGTTVDANVTVSGITSITGDIYGGGSLADSTSSEVVIGSTTVNDVYGGGEQASVDTTKITINGAIGGDLFGGSNVSGDVTTSDILINSGKFDNVFGGNNQGGTTATTNIEVKAGTIGNVYGGGNHAASTTSNVIIKSGNITNVFGGGNEAGLTTANVDIYGGTIDSVYGGSNAAGDITDANVYIDSQASSNDFVSVDVTSAPVAAEDWQSTTYDTYVPMTFKITNTSDQIVEDWEVKVNMPSDANIFSNYSGSDFTITDGVAVINAVNKYDANAPYSLDSGESYSIEFAILTNTSITDFEATASIVKPKSSGVITGGIVINNVYGGNNLGGTTTNPIVDINAGDIGNVYGGGNMADVNSTKVYIDNTLVDVVFGGGNAAKTTTDTLVDINNSIVNDSVYGGGNEGVVSGSTEVFLTNTSVALSAYAGGNGSTAIVSVDTSITVDGTSVIGTSSSVAPAGSVFGSGKAAATGNAASNSSVATVNIVGATIYGNVYGGANTSVVYGKTFTNIGTVAVNNSSLVEEDVIIQGTVFGGGEANASGSENYDFEFISVTDAIDINIDGTGYIDNSHKFIMNGSIFGSGNASSSSGTSEIYIKNLGTRSSPSKNISIQRANVVVFDNSVVELSGATDRTNDYSYIKYSFNRIDSLTIKNNTVLLLKQNANLLKEFNSMVDVDGEEVPATVTINDEDQSVTKNVDNRLYMIPNSNLNITTNQSATAYGKVTGMTFFGMYNSYDSGAFQYGVYADDVENGDATSASDIIIGGSYVKGLHHTNHDITVDGFYTNYMSEDYSTVTTAYIEPTPPETGFYMWAIGVQAVNYKVDLNASKYSSLGTLELSMPEFADGDTTFHIIGFNSEGLREGVSLVEPTTVPKITEMPEEANKILGLAMKTETREWTSYATTKFFTSDPPYSGDLSFKTDSQQVAPSVMFYLYHAKNITLNEEIGSVVISLQAETPINEIESELQLITITVNITATEYEDGDYYDASITYDKKYEMPSATSVNITNQSQFTAYYSLFTYAESFEDFYGIDNTNYHALVTNRVLPVGTQVTMIDIADGSSNPEYYYYTVDTDNYNVALQQLEDYGEVAYKLSDFIRMGSVDEDNTYDDALMNQVYYSTEYDMVIEEFIFIFDFKETTVTGTHLDNSMLFELRNKDDRNVVSVLGIRQNIMLYNTYDSSNVVLEETVTPDSNYLYYDIPATYALTTAIAYDQTGNSEAIINTNYESNSMGLNVEVLDSVGTKVSSSMLTGTNIMIDNVRYFADSDGVFRIKLAGKVSNINRNMYITTDKMLPSGTYTLRFTLFASPDGKHNSHLLESAYVDIPVTVVGSDNSIVVETVDETKVVYGETGLNELGLDYNEYTISSNSVLSDPNIRISVYKRSVANKDTTEYEEVPISNLFTNYFVDPSSKSYTATSTYEKLLNVTVGSKNTLSFSLADNLISGTYRVVFKLYDKDQLIQDEIKYVIVRKNIE